jgi:D-alanyl-lipoteichoic acid acyltransferase DltB (MBOAT superfamily)
MTVTQVLILALAAMLINALKRWRLHAMLATGVVAMYWLQPTQEPVNLVFWLPTILIALVVVVWALTSSPESRDWKKNSETLALLGGTIAVMDISRYYGFDALISVETPRPQWLIPVLLALLLASFGLSRLGRFSTPGRITAVLGLIGLLICIKLPWILSSAVQWLGDLRGKETGFSVISWLGISYVSFRLLHTLFDRLAGRLPSLSLAEYVNYVIFFPSITAGPIDRAERFVKDLRNPLPLENTDLMEAGTRLFAGLFKKFVLADALGWIALNEAYLLDSKTAGWVWFFLYAYSFQIYFDFSGYTDIAIGLGRLMGIRLPENFNAPYSKPNLSQFWNSWHMTLTHWFRSYFFNPLTRRMRSTSRPLSLPVMILISQVSTMILIGLWHGITYNFFLWGVWHGIGLFLQNRWSEQVKPHSGFAAVHPLREKLTRYAGIFLTFNFVSLGWLFFIFSTPAMVWTALLRLAGMR